MNKFVKRFGIYTVIVLIIYGVYNLSFKFLQPFLSTQSSQMQLNDNYEGFVAVQSMHHLWNSIGFGITVSLIVLFVLMFYKDIISFIKKMF